MLWHLTRFLTLAIYLIICRYEAKHNTGPPVVANGGGAAAAAAAGGGGGGGGGGRLGISAAKGGNVSGASRAPLDIVQVCY